MCGIVLAQSPDEARRMLKVISHRGRDQSAVCEQHGLWVGTNRLIIVDHGDENAEQPMINSSSIVAFNGEIFNRDVLFEAMLRDDNLIKPKSMAEVQIIDALMRRHPGNFERFLDGYYAIIRIDRHNNEVTIARDMLGVIPLYYQTVPGLRIGSERKCMGHEAAFELQPGECITFSETVNLQAKSVGWKVKSRRRYEPISLHLEPMHYEHLEFLFDRAVRRRIEHSEVPVCIALSGGLDSALVLASAARQGFSKLHALTVCLDPNSIEAKNAMIVAKQFQVRHDLIVVTHEQIEQERELILWALEDDNTNPIKYAAMVRNYFVAKHADATVILCGEGADELGCGYPSHRGLHGLQKEWKSYSTLKSMHAINLDRVNKGGMWHTKEYRTPFLDRALVLYCMGCEKGDNKKHFRQLGMQFKIPQEILEKQKYSQEEQLLWMQVRQWGSEVMVG